MTQCLSNDPIEQKVPQPPRPRPETQDQVFAGVDKGLLIDSLAG